MTRPCAIALAVLLTFGPWAGASRAWAQPAAGTPEPTGPPAGVDAAVEHALDAPEPAGRVALVLGGGAARGTAHVGVLRVLLDAGVPIDMIVGTSMGSLIGGLYAAGFDVDTLAEVVMEFDPSSAGELLLPPRGGILDGRPLAMLIDAMVEGRRLDEVTIPFHAVVVDLFSGEPQSAPPGPLADAIRASAAIPVLFDPVEIDGRYYVDGGLRQTIPTALARSLGADYVIAVDVSRELPYDPGNVQANLTRIFIGIVDAFYEQDLEQTDVVLDPGLRHNTYMDFDLSAGFMRAGERVALAELPRILADLDELGIERRPPGDPHEGLPINEGWRERLAVARREVAVRPRPWNLDIDLAFAPTAGERVTPAPAPVGSRLRFGVDLRDGPLGRGYVGASYGRSVTGGDDAVRLRAGYRLSYAWSVDGRVDRDFGGGWRTRWSVRWLAAPGVSAEVALRSPGAALDTGVRWRGPGLWLDGAASAGMVDGWVRAHLEARGAVGLADPRLSTVTLRGRLFLGGATVVPGHERFSVGPATGLRGTPPDTWTTTALGVASLEVAGRLGSGRAVLEAAVLTPVLWTFVDTAWFDDDGVGRQVWAVGVGAGLDGSLFGFVPFSVGFDLGYGLTAGSWYLGWRIGPSWPDPWRF